MGDHVGWVVVLGFLLQGVLEYVSQGIEHGHMHSSHTKGSARMPWAMFFSLCLHALIESMPLHGEDHGHVHHDHDHHGHVHLHGIEGVDMALLMGLILHKLPVALVLMGMLDALGIKRSSRWLAMVVFGLRHMSPLKTRTWSAIAFRSVVLPEPLGPTKPTISPASIRNDRGPITGAA